MIFETANSALQFIKEVASALIQDRNESNFATRVLFFEEYVVHKRELLVKINIVCICDKSYVVFSILFRDKTSSN